jgi:hypothetical protein
MDEDLRTEDVTAAAEWAINRGWYNRLRLIVERHPDYVNQTHKIGAMSLGGRRLGEDADILSCVEHVAEKGMSVTTTLPGLDSCFKYCPSVAHFLLSRGLDPNLMDGDGNTGLHYMAEIGHVSAAKRLVTDGTDRDDKNEAGLTAWDIAKREGNRKTQECLEGTEVEAGGDKEVRWFSRRRKQGYIGHSTIGDIYFEHSCDPGQGIEEGTGLEFDLQYDDFGPVAVNIRFI